MAEPLLKQQEPFLDHCHRLKKTDQFEERCSTAGREKSYFFCICILTGLLLTSFMSNIWILVHLERGQVRNHHANKFTVQAPFSPVDRLITYEMTSINTHDSDDRFGGPPDEAFDRAWSELLFGASIRVTPDELKRAGKQSLRLRDSDEEIYLAYIESFHQLHCVKRIVQNRWPERYPELAGLGAFTDEHFNHCIQVLRKGVMCSGDTTLNTYVWDSRNSTLITGVSDAPRKCVNWDRIDEWVRERAVRHIYDVLTPEEDGFMGPVL